MLMTLLSMAATRAAAGQVPVVPDTTPAPLQNVQSFTIDSDPGSQFDPHVDGNLISYSYRANDGTGTRIRYFRVGVDATPQEIPRGPGEQDFLSHVSAGRITYSHVDIRGTTIRLLDTTQPIGPGNPLEISQAGINSFSAAIGGNTVAYIDEDLGINGELVAFDLLSNTATRLTNDTETDQNPALAPDGNTIVWEHCPVDTNHCDIWQAVKTGATWTVSAVSSDPATEDHADTTGSVIVYASDRPAGSSDIFYRYAGGAIEYDLQLPGIQAASNIAGDVVVFAGNQTGKYDIYAYQISTNRLWNTTNSAVDTLLCDVSMLPNGNVIVVYESVERSAALTTLHVTTFTVPAVATDTDPPTISIATPASAGIYAVNSALTAQYSCADSGSGVASCIGTVANGAAMSTASAGPKTFVVNAQDVAGNTASLSVSYSISYQVCLLYDSTKAKKSGSTYPIQIRLCDANGQNVSASPIVVHATAVTQVSTNASGTLDDAGNSNPDFDFRFDATTASYIFNLKTTGFATGTYALAFTAGTDPVVHTAMFQIK
jgi:WD40 repeat protein